MKRSTLRTDVMHTYSAGDVLQYRALEVTYLNEKALDDGGVTRDLFSAFWEEAYVEYFDGPSSNQLTPSIFPSVDLSSYVVLGSIMVLGYLVSGTSHICSGELVLPTSYKSQQDFTQEFTTILNSEYAWIMDAV